MHSLLLVIIAATAASASLVRRSDPLTPGTKRGPKCTVRGDSLPTCPKGFFCYHYRDCYEPIPLGQPCPGERNDCAEPGYCKIRFESKTPGVCTHRQDVGALCGGLTQDRCGKDLACVLPETKKSFAVGKCFALPLKEGMTCNWDSHCGSNGYCYMEDHHQTAGICKPRAQLNQECGEPFANNRVAARCADGLGCYIKEEKGKGICLKNNGGVGAKCYENGGLDCDSEQDVFCKYGSGKTDNVCAPRSRLGDKCNEEIPCGRDVACYNEGEFGTDGVCLNKENNPIGSKCDDAVHCVEGTNCSYFPGKYYGVCAKTPSKNP